MNLDAVIRQIRTAVPDFTGNVAGAAAFAQGVEDQVWLPMPAAFVVPLDEEAGENESLTGLQQIVTERIAVIVTLDNSADRRGQAASDRFDGTRSALFAALLNWRPDFDPSAPSANREARGFRYAGGRLLEFDRARLFYQWEFALDITITEQEGWHEGPGSPLTDARIHIDAALPFDRSGTYPAPQAPAYTPAAAPRTGGPDGRDEGALAIPLAGG